MEAYDKCKNRIISFVHQRWMPLIDNMEPKELMMHKQEKNVEFLEEFWPDKTFKFPNLYDTMIK